MLYNMVCRSLFAKDKLLYSFMLCLKCQETDKELNLVQLMLLLTGVGGAATEPRPEDSEWMTDVTWNRVGVLATIGDVFSGGRGLISRERGLKEHKLNPNRCETT